MPICRLGVCYLIAQIIIFLPFGVCLLMNSTSDAGNVLALEAERLLSPSGCRMSGVASLEEAMGVCEVD